MSTLYEYYNAESNYDYWLGINMRLAQTFTPTISHKITSVKLLLFRNGSPGTISVGIKATDENGYPTGDDLCGGTTNGNTLTSDLVGEWREITLGDGYNLTASTKYSIVIKESYIDDDNVTRWLSFWIDSEVDPYDGGNLAVYNGSYWESYEAESYHEDFLFEEWGTAGGGAVYLVPSGIATLEAFGTAKANRNVKPSGLATLEAFGTDKVNRNVKPSSVASTQAFGTQKLNLAVAPSSIASLAAFGSISLIIQQFLVLSGVASLEYFGAAKLNRYVLPSGIASLQALGNPTLALGAISVYPSGVASLETFGTQKLNRYALPSGIASLEAFGTAKLKLLLLPSGIATLEYFGAAKTIFTVKPVALTSLEAFGTGHVIIQQFLIPSGIASLQAFGAPVLNIKQSIIASAINSSETFGNLIIKLLLQKLYLSGIASLEAFGTDKVNRNVKPSGVATLETFGTLVIPILLQPTARFIGSGEVSIDDSALSDYFHLSKFTAQFSENITQIRIYSQGNMNVKIALYADNAGEPGSLLNAVNTALAVVAGWNALNFPATSIVLGTDYWLALNSG